MAGFGADQAGSSIFTWHGVAAPGLWCSLLGPSPTSSETHFDAKKKRIWSKLRPCVHKGCHQEWGAPGGLGCLGCLGWYLPLRSWNVPPIGHYESCCVACIACPLETEADENALEHKEFIYFSFGLWDEYVVQGVGLGPKVMLNNK